MKDMWCGVFYFPSDKANLLKKQRTPVEKNPTALPF